MKTVISLHSFVDLITNSSSELFICDTKKSVATVKETIEALAELYNERRKLGDNDAGGYGTVSTHGLWTSVFSEPYAAKYNFQLTDFPRYKEWMEMYSHDYANHWYSDGSQLSTPEREAQHALEDWEKDNPRRRYKEKPTAKEEEASNAAFDAWNKANHAAADKIYKKWNDMELDIYTDLYKWVAKVNKVNLAPLGKIEINRGRYSKVYFTGMVGDNYEKGMKLKAAKFIDEIENAISWGYTFKKGDVFLHSASDNSIPYDFWPDIESTFNCQRRHLG